MLPNFYRQYYQEFQQALRLVQQTATATQVDAPQLQQNFRTAQQLFQQQILSLNLSDLAADEPRVRSYQTEINKQLRLLEIDITFLQAARQPGTATSRQTQILQRVQNLLGYCDGILKLNSGT